MDKINATLHHSYSFVLGELAEKENKTMSRVVKDLTVGWVMKKRNE